MRLLQAVFLLLVLPLVQAQEENGIDRKMKPIALAIRSMVILEIKVYQNPDNVFLRTELRQFVVADGRKEGDISRRLEKAKTNSSKVKTGCRAAAVEIQDISFTGIDYRTATVKTLESKEYEWTDGTKVSEQSSPHTYHVKEIGGNLWKVVEEVPSF